MTASWMKASILNLWRTLIRGKMDALHLEVLWGSAASVAMKLAFALLTFATAVALARGLGAKNYGIYAYVISLTTLLAVPAQLGLPQLLVRETAKFEASGEWGAMRGLWRWSNISVLIFSGVLLACAGFACLAIRDRLDFEQLVTASIGTLLIPLVALGNLRGASLRGLRKVVAGLFPENVVRPALTILIFYLMVLLTPTRVGAAEAMTATAISAGISYAFGAWLLNHSLPAQLAIKPVPEYRKSAWRAAAIPIGLTTGLQIVNAQTDLLVLGLYRTPEEVGAYRVAISSAGFVAFGLQAVNMVVGPYFARLYEKGELNEVRRLMNLTAILAATIGIPITAALVIFGQPLLSVVFGAGFAIAATPMAILAVGQLANAATGSVGSLLMMTGNERSYAAGVFVAMIVNICMNLILVRLYGMTGAAISSGLCITALNLYWFTTAHEKLKRQRVSEYQ